MCARSKTVTEKCVSSHRYLSPSNFEDYLVRLFRNGSSWYQNRSNDPFPEVTIGCLVACRGVSLIRKRPPLGPYSRPVPRLLRQSQRGERFLMSEVPLYGSKQCLKTGDESLPFDLSGITNLVSQASFSLQRWKNVFRGTSLIKKRIPLGPYRRPMRGVLVGS